MAGPLCFSRPLIMTLAVPLLLLMVFRGRRPGPAANGCSVISKAVYFTEFQPEFQKAALKFPGQQSPSVSRMVQ